jgi:hypothetical protein
MSRRLKLVEAEGLAAVVAQDGTARGAAAGAQEAVVLVAGVGKAVRLQREISTF